MHAYLVSFSMVDVHSTCPNLFLKQSSSYWQRLSNQFFLIFSLKNWITTFYFVCKFEENQSEFETVRVPHLKTHKKGRYNVINAIYKTISELSFPDLLRLCVQILFESAKTFGNHRPEQKHTHILMHRQGSSLVNIFSSEMNEKKN